jgi:hypothetical protein
MACGSCAAGSNLDVLIGDDCHSIETEKPGEEEEFHNLAGVFWGAGDSAGSRNPGARIPIGPKPAFPISLSLPFLRP